MAITDNTFEPQELTAAVAANPALVAHLVGAVKSAGYVARTADEENTFIGTKTKEIYDGLDKDLFDTSGITKEGTEKTYDYAKRVVKTVKEAATPLQQEIDRLKKQIADGNGDATMKAQLEQLQQQEQEWKTEKETYTKQLFEKDVKLDIRDGVRGLKFDPSVKESVMKVLVNAATERLLGQAKLQQNADGTSTVVYIQDGKTRLNKENQPADAAFLLAEELKDVLDNGQAGQGGGAGPQGGTGGQGGKGGVLPAARPATIKTQRQLIDWLKEHALVPNTKDFDEAFDKFSDGLPIG